MLTLFWTLIALIIAGAIYWIMDWQSHNENGEGEKE